MTDANGSTFATRFTDALEAWSVTTASIGARPGPFTVDASYGDSCRPFAGRTRPASQGGV